MKVKYKLLLGKKAKYTKFGLNGCVHGRSDGGSNYYVYGFKGFFNFIIDERWGYFI